MSMPCYKGRVSFPLGEKGWATHALHDELILVLDGLLLLEPGENLTEPLLLVLINPVVEVGVEVDEGLRGAAELLKEVDIVDGINGGHTAPLRRLVL
jgi:hypothetical protein